MNEHATAVAALAQITTEPSLMGIVFILVLFVLFMVVGVGTWLAVRSRQTKQSLIHRATPIVFVGVFMFGGAILCSFLVLFFARANLTPTLVRTETHVVQANDFDLTDATPGFSDASLMQSQSTPAEWLSADLKAFDADVYPGMTQAAGPLAREIRETLMANRLLESDPKGDGFIEPTSITIFTSRLDETARSLIIESFAAELRQQFDRSKISIGGPGSSAGDTVYGNIIALTITTRNEKPPLAHVDLPWSGGVSGDLHCEAVTNSGKAEASVRYTDKPWVEEFSSFASRYPSRFVVGYSTSLAPSENEAKQEAIQDAADRLRRYNLADVAMFETAACDQFIQKLSRPYGDVWRVAMLYDLPSLVTKHAMPRAAMAAERQSHRRLLVLLFIQTIIICGVLNMVTYGYYRMQIGVGWVVLVLGLLAVGGLFMA